MKTVALVVSIICLIVSVFVFVVTHHQAKPPHIVGPSCVDGVPFHSVRTGTPRGVGRHSGDVLLETGNPCLPVQLQKLRKHCWCEPEATLICEGDTGKMKVEWTVRERGP